MLIFGRVDPMEMILIVLAACISSIDNDGPVQDDDIEAFVSVSTSSLETIWVYDE
jgi:hypothetical protein